MKYKVPREVVVLVFKNGRWSKDAKLCRGYKVVVHGDPDLLPHVLARSMIIFHGECVDVITSRAGQVSKTLIINQDGEALELPYTSLLSESLVTEVINRRSHMSAVVAV